MLRIRHLLALSGGVALVSIVMAFVIVTNRQGADYGLPPAQAAPVTTAATTTATSAATGTTTSSTATPTAATTTAVTTAPSGTTTSDGRGYVNSPARCPEGQTATAFGRTKRSQVVICASGDGSFEYRGVRLSDDATLQTAAEASGDGFVARPDGATYTVSPTTLEVVSGGKVIYRDTWIDYHSSTRSTERGETPTASPTTPTTSTTATTSTSATTTTGPTRSDG